MKRFGPWLTPLLVPLLVAAHTLPVLVDLLLPEAEHHCACPLEDHHCTCPICSGDARVAEEDWERKTLVPEPCGLLPAKPALLARIPAVVTEPDEAPAPVGTPARGPAPAPDTPLASRTTEPPTPPPRVA